MVEGKAGFRDEEHACRSGLNTEGKLDISLSPAVQPLKQPSLSCPECDSKKLWKSGFRVLTNGSEVQRWLCRDCGYRFSEKKSQDLSFNPLKPLKEPSKKLLNSSYSINNECQVCGALTRGTKNLTKVESRTRKWAAGATTEAEVKGKLVDFMWNLKRDGYSLITIKNYVYFLQRLVRRGADLMNPESVKDIIAKQNLWGNSTKFLAVAAYQKFALVNGINWKPPKYRLQRKLPFIPLEKEIDALIACCGKKIATTLQLLKETAMRIGEALRLEWIDIDFETNAITLNNPEKNGLCRRFKMSAKLAAMLNMLPKTNQRVFGTAKTNNVVQNFCRQRKRAAAKLQNPRLLRIRFHTLRHWKATIEYHKTKDILHVMKLLGHRRIENTLIYTQLVDFETEDYHSATAETIEEARKLVEAGFEYVCTHEGYMLFRKRK